MALQKRDGDEEEEEKWNSAEFTLYFRIRKLWESEKLFVITRMTLVSGKIMGIVTHKLIIKGILLCVGGSR